MCERCCFWLRVEFESTISTKEISRILALVHPWSSYREHTVSVDSIRVRSNRIELLKPRFSFTKLYKIEVNPFCQRPRLQVYKHTENKLM